MKTTVLLITIGLALINTYLMHESLTSRAHAHTLQIPQKTLSHSSQGTKIETPIKLTSPHVSRSIPSVVNVNVSTPYMPITCDTQYQDSHAHTVQIDKNLLNSDLLDQNSTKTYNMNVHTVRDVVSDTLKKGAIWEKQLLELMLFSLNQMNGKSTIIDIGANIGFFTSFLASENHSVLAIEAFQFNINRLASTICLNEGMQDKVKVVKVALSDTANLKMCMWSTNKETNNGNARLTPAFEGFKDFDNDKHVKCEEYVNTYTLDSLLFTIEGEFQLRERPIIMKMDVEGSETKILQGAKQFLGLKFAPCLIFFEHQPIPTKTTGVEVTDIFDILTTANYDIFYPGDLVRSKELRSEPRSISRDEWKSVHGMDFVAILSCHKMCQCPRVYDIATQATKK